MILQALVNHYEALLKQGQISPPGWGQVGVSYALCIDDVGALEQVICVKTEQQRGKKTVLVRQNMRLPAPVKRSSGIVPNFLCDNAAYFLGVDSEGKSQRARDCFAEAGRLHHQILSGVDTPAAKALLAFFDSWDPEMAESHPVLLDGMENIEAGANLVFRYDGDYIHNDPAIRQAWDAYYSRTEEEGGMGICLVTGHEDMIEPVHPSIKGVQGAQSSGASLVSFNADAFCSYGKTQNYNAPVGKYAAFAYTTALNHLLADRKHVFRMGDATVVFWAESAEEPYQELMGMAAFGMSSHYEENELRDVCGKLCQGMAVEFEEELLDPEMRFYILGLSPNSARLSVRFFLQNSFGNFLRNVQAHHQRMEIIRPAFDKFELIPLWKMLDETVNQNARNKSPVPNLAGETLRSVLNDAPYPAQLLSGVELRIRAEREISRGRAAIIKAYYLKNRHSDVPEEVLTVSLNPNSVNVPYILGRLFSVLESIQSAANPGINTTIKDRYFSSASATPAHVFPTLINLAQKHLKKLDAGLAIHYDKLLTELLGKLEEAYPNHLSIPQQGAFQLGYYHQTQARYTGKKMKEENENG